MSAQPTPNAPRRSTGFYFVVMGLPMICLTAVAVVWILKTPATTAATPPPQPAQVVLDAPKPIVVQPVRHVAEVPEAVEKVAPEAPIKAAVEATKKQPPETPPAVKKRPRSKPVARPKPRPVRPKFGADWGDVLKGD